MALVDECLNVITGNISSVIVFVVLFVLGYLALITRPKHSNLPPGPRRLPIIGNLLLMRNRDPRDLFKELGEIYGDIFSLQVFNKVFIVVNGYDSLKELFVKEGDRTSDRFISEYVNFTNGHTTTGVILASGKRWKENRRFCLSHLRNFGMGKGLIETKIHEEANIFLDEVESHNGKPFDIKHLMHNGTSNVLAMVLFGHRFEYDDEVFQEYLRCMDENSSGNNTNPLFVRPALRHVPGDPFKVRRMVNNGYYAMKFYRNEVQTQKDNFKPGVIDTLLHAYLDEWKRAEQNGDSSEYSDGELEMLVRDVFGAGAESTALTIIWCIIYMMQNPDVQTRIQSEIDEHIPKDRLPNMDEKPKLVMMEAAILETLRISSLVPFSVPHRAATYFEFKGYSIPRDAYLIQNLHSVHFNEKLFPNATKFDPSRFIDGQGKIITMDEVLPFSIGRRICLGESLAKSEIFLFLTALLQRFQIVPPEGSPPPPAKGTLGIVHGPYPFLMRAVKR